MELPALAFLAVVLTVKEAGLPIPVPGDLLVIGAGAAASTGGLPAIAIVLVLIVASVVGGTIQFILIRGRARTAILALLARFGLQPATVDRGAARFRNGGARPVALARMTPGLRIVAIASSAIANVDQRSFLIGLVIGNAVFLTGHFLLGLLVGEPAVKLVAGAGTGLIAAAVAFAALGAIGWWFLARRGTRPAAGGLVVLDWADACCPACLALARITPGS